MWTTNVMKENAIKLINHWGFGHVTTMFTWHKVKDGKEQSIPGVYSDTSTEELLVATRGQVYKYLRKEIRVR